MTEPPMLLGQVGVEPIEEQLYRCLLAASPQSLTDLAGAIGMPVALLRGPVERLTSLGFITALGDGAGLYVPVPPDLALPIHVSREELKLRQRIDEIARLRAAAANLARDLTDESPPQDETSLRMIDGVGVLRQTMRDVALFARTRLRHIDSAIGDENLDVRADVTQHAIYTRSAIDDDEHFQRIQKRQRRGEDVRLIRQPPLRAIIADDDLALLLIRDHDCGVDYSRGVLLRPSPLLSAVTTLFDLLWERAIPLHRDGTEDARWRISDDDAALLRLLAAGLKDQAIARHLGIGLRTVVRRIGILSRALDADTRFQAGLQAARRGLL